MSDSEGDESLVPVEHDDEGERALGAPTAEPSSRLVTIKQEAMSMMASVTHGGVSDRAWEKVTPEHVGYHFETSRIVAGKEIEDRKNARIVAAVLVLGLTLIFAILIGVLVSKDTNSELVVNMVVAFISGVGGLGGGYGLAKK